MSAQARSTLLILEIIPERIELYLIPNEALTPRQVAWLLEAHGRTIIDAGMDDGERFVHAATCRSTSRRLDPAFEEHRGAFVAFHDSTVGTNPPELGCGFRWLTMTDTMITDVRTASVNLSSSVEVDGT